MPFLKDKLQMFQIKLNFSTTILRYCFVICFLVHSLCLFLHARIQICLTQFLRHAFPVRFVWKPIKGVDPFLLFILYAFLGMSSNSSCSPGMFVSPMCLQRLFLSLSTVVAIFKTLQKNTCCQPNKRQISCGKYFEAQPQPIGLTSHQSCPSYATLI